MLNMFTFDVFLVWHSLGQSVMGIITLFILWLISPEYSLSQKFDVLPVCHSLGLSVMGKTMFIFWLSEEILSFQKI